jgi:ParB-like chromosome segregation protein Spo0J
MGLNNWPAYTVEHWTIDRLRPYAGNAKRHPPKQIQHLRASLRQFGWTIPILVRGDGTVIAGHARLEAGQAEGVKEIPVIIANHWSDAQCRAYGLADNKLSELGEWDEDALIAEVLATRDEIPIPGFDDADIKKLVHTNDVEVDVSPQLSATLEYSVIIRCENEQQQVELLKRFEREGLKCETLIS